MYVFPHISIICINHKKKITKKGEQGEKFEHNKITCHKERDSLTHFAPMVSIGTP